MRTLASLRTKISPVSVDLSCTTAVYLTCSMAAVRDLKSCAAWSIMDSTYSRVIFAGACELPTTRGPERVQSAITKRKERNFLKTTPQAESSAFTEQEIVAYDRKPQPANRHLQDPSSMNCCVEAIEERKWPHAKTFWSRGSDCSDAGSM